MHIGKIVFGLALLASTAADGSDVKVTGYYVTGWKRRANGAYKFNLDIGGADKPAQ